MKKPTLISALTVAVIATAGMALPAGASAATFAGEAVKKVHADNYRGHRDHRGVDRRYIERHHDYRRYGHSRWAPPRHQHRHGHHYGHKQGYGYRHRYDDDIRVRIFYDLHL